MELKLVVKEKGKGKKKTYTANAVDLSFGVVDDTIKALSPEKVDFLILLRWAKLSLVHGNSLPLF